MGRIFRAYKDLLGILLAESPFVVISAFVVSVVAGALRPVSIWVGGQVFNSGLAVAAGEMPFAGYIPTIALFVAVSVLSVIAGWMLLEYYVEPRSQLILRTAYKGKMLQKLKRLKYEHLESAESMEIIDKAYNRTEMAARHLFPMYIYITLSAVVGTAGTLYMLFSVRWWLVLTVLLPFALDTWLAQKFYFNIYDEMEGYWNSERRYGILGNMLRSREFIPENRLHGAAGFLINIYRKRLNSRNREYERFYFKHLRQQFTKRNVLKLAQLANALLLLWLYMQGALSIGLLITLTLCVFNSLFSYEGLRGCAQIFVWSGFHIKTYDFYDKYFALSEDEPGEIDSLPDDFSIEFDNVHFTYPGTDKLILNGLTLTVAQGESVSIVGENGEGKTTMIKLLLGLFKPDSGQIRVGGKPVESYTQAARSRIFGPVFQDFVRYAISLEENVGVGNVGKAGEPANVAAAMEKAGVTAFLDELPGGAQTLLGREFEGGIDLSGGQWQRIAIARAFMGDKPVLILDEPTSQLDPMAESRLYSEFAQMAGGKTAIFITHRLGSTMITDRIFVIAGGRVTQSGTHDELMRSGGLYAEMFNSQKQWYVKSGGGGQGDDE